MPVRVTIRRRSEEVPEEFIVHIDPSAYTCTKVGIIR